VFAETAAAQSPVLLGLFGERFANSPGEWFDGFKFRIGFWSDETGVGLFH
jgi:hypothetical protein